MSNMRQNRVYDLPTRLFHWLFAGLFIGAYGIAQIVDDESSAFGYHSLAGVLIVFLILFRIVWGLLGTRYARFSGFALKPADLVQYFLGVLTGSKRRWAGHNPASSWAALTMMVLALGAGVSGYFMANGSGPEFLEDIHELFANGLMLTAGVHISGLILHSLRHRDGIAFSMIDGKKDSMGSELPSVSSHKTVGVALLASTAALSIYLAKNYNPNSMTLNLFGSELQIGENESDEKNDFNGMKEHSTEGHEADEVEED